jgi:FkbM family methyltransferase
MSMPRSLRNTAYRWHCLVARSERATRLYVHCVAALARRMPGPRLGPLMEWFVTSQGVPWRPLSFAAREVVVGERTRVRMHPHLGEFDQAALFRRHLDYEKPVFAWLERHAAQRYEAVVEIGANVGIYTVFLDALIKGAPEGRLRHVYAFEPSGRAFARLLANLEASDARSVSPLAAAVSDRTGVAPFFEPKGHLTNGSLCKAFAEQFSPSVRAGMVVALAGSALAGIFERHTPVLVKIDAEGAEPQILRSLAPLLERHSPDLLIEVLPGVDEELERDSGLAGYARLHLTVDGASLRDAIRADAANRDWLLTRSPAGVAGL